MTHNDNVKVISPDNPYFNQVGVVITTHTSIRKMVSVRFPDITEGIWFYQDDLELL